MDEDTRRYRLVIEAEIPDFYAEEMTRAALAQWMEVTGETYEQALLSDLRCGDMVALLTVFSEGEKDAEVVTATALIRSARIIPADESAALAYVDDHIEESRARLVRDAWNELRYEASFRETS